MLKVALGQFAVSRVWEENAQVCEDLMRRAREAGAGLLILPEGILARDITDPQIVLKAAQPLDGPFVSRLLAASRGSRLATLFCVHVPTGDGRVWNTLVTLRDGEIISEYRKLHLYDAFNMKESTNVTPGDRIPPLLEIDGLKIGLMTCYDVRFPEMARRAGRRRPAGAAGGLGARFAQGKPLGSAGDGAGAGKHLLRCRHRRVRRAQHRPQHGGGSAGRGDGQRGRGPALVVAEIDPERLAHARKVLPVLANRRFAAPELA